MLEADIPAEHQIWILQKNDDIRMRRNSHRTPVVHSCVEVPISTASQVDIVDAAEVGSTGLGTASVGEALELQEDIWNGVVFHSVLQEECYC